MPPAGIEKTKKKKKKKKKKNRNRNRNDNLKRTPLSVCNQRTFPPQPSFSHFPGRLYSGPSSPSATTAMIENWPPAPAQMSSRFFTAVFSIRVGSSISEPSALATLLVHIEPPTVGLAGRIDAMLWSVLTTTNFCRPDCPGGQLGWLDQDLRLIRGVFYYVGGRKRVMIKF